MGKSSSISQFPGIALDLQKGVPMYRQLYEALRQAILECRIRPGQRVPATRVLASELEVSRNTVLLAFDHLFSEGYLDGKTGSGTYVSKTLPEKLLNVDRSTASSRASSSKRRRLSLRGRLIAGIPVSFPDKLQPFQHGAPSLRDFPFDVWSRLTTRQFRNGSQSLFGYGDPAGYGSLREAIATYLRTARAVKCEAEQIIVVNGSQQALDLAARVLLDPGEIALLEDPGYLGARKALAGAGVKLVPAPVDEDGLDLEKCPRRENARLVYVTPSHQYPLGVTMSLARRLRLLEWAAQAGVWILEDDYDSEYRYSGRPLASLQGLDRHNRVIYMGTFSKVLFPALRLGYLVVPADLVEGFLSAKGICDRNSHTIEQAVLASFMEEGHFGRHVRRMRLLYQQRQEILLQKAQEQLGGLLRVEPADSGMHLVGWLPEDADDQEISRRAAESGLTVPALSSYGLQWQKPGLLLGYPAFEEREIREGVNRLATLLYS